ncbi:MAG TPA: hypothetical protein VLB09_02350 [Nitrospiria bacterium]|nr:hypothetical protein [Nitrospiria bacterium]
MKKMSWIATLVFIVSILLPVHSHAEDVTAKEIFKDSLYGGLVGALVGGALLVFRDDRSDHLDMIAYGAAAGVIVGAVYGLTKAGRALAEFEDGRIHVGVPEIEFHSLSATPKELSPEARVRMFALRF